MGNFKNPTKVITGPNTTFSYLNCFEPKAIQGGTPKYSVSLIIPKSDTKTIEKIKAAIQAAYEEGQSKLKGNGKSIPALSVLKTPLRDGDEERPDDEAYPILGDLSIKDTTNSTKVFKASSSSALSMYSSSTERLVPIAIPYSSSIAFIDTEFGTS